MRDFFYMKKLKYFLLAKSIGFYINLISFVNPKKASALAYQFFSEPRVGKLTKEKLPKILQNASTETIYHNEHHFQIYTWNGNSNVILLVHGWESNASRWKKILPYLQKSGSTIIAIDAPAHGLSSGKEFNVPQYVAFMHVIIQKHKPKHIIGHSLGGIASAYYQHLYKNHSIEKLVLLGSPSDFTILLSNYIQLLSLNSRVHQSLIEYTKDRFQIIAENFSTSNFLYNSRIQGIIAHDIDDKVVSFKEGEKIANSWKNANFIETKGLGHSMHDDDLYTKIAHFLFEIR